MNSGPSPASRHLLAILGLAVGLSWGCSRKSQVEAGTRSGVFHLAVGSEPADLDPNTDISSDTNPIYAALFEGLTTMSNDGVTVLPGVAERWEVSGDQLTYTFHLRADAKWSNGAPLTADDFLFSFRRVFDPQLACEESSYGYMIAGAEAFGSGKTTDPGTVGLSAPDPHTFVIRLAHPTAYFLSVLSVGTPFLPVYRPLLEKFNGVRNRGAAWSREGNLISNGPFTLTQWTQDKVIVVKRSATYWDTAHEALNEIRFYPIDDAGAQERGFRAGQFHVTAKFPISRGEAYRSVVPQLLYLSPSLNIHMVTFNLAKFPDARVRRALSLALDREKMIPAVYGIFATVAHSYTRPGVGGYEPPVSPACQYRPEEAKALLAAAGYPGGKGFPPIDLMLVGNDQDPVRMGEVVQSAWKSVLGVSTNLLPTENKVYLDAERTQQFTAVIERWGASWNDPTAVLETAVSHDPNNDSGWGNAEFDQSFHEAETLPASAERLRLFDRDEEILAAEVPYAPLFHANLAWLVDPAVKGWRLNALNLVNWKQVSLQP